MKYSFKAPAGGIDWTKVEKIAIGAVIAALGALLTYALAHITGTEFGPVLTPIVVVVLSTAVNAARQWAKDYEAAPVGFDGDEVESKKTPPAVTG